MKARRGEAEAEARRGGGGGGGEARRRRLAAAARAAAPRRPRAAGISDAFNDGLSVGFTF